MDDAAIYLFLQKFRYGVISSVNTAGSPQSALVGIAVTPQLEIVFDTLRSTRKYANLLARPQGSFVIGWGGEQTVQFEGIAIEPAGAERTLYQEIYFTAWPDGRSHTAWPGITYLVVQPRWIRYSDFDQTPPLIVERSFPA